MKLPELAFFFSLAVLVACSGSHPELVHVAPSLTDSSQIPRMPSESSRSSPLPIDTVQLLQKYLELMSTGALDSLLRPRSNCPMPVVRSDSSLRDSMPV